MDNARKIWDELLIAENGAAMGAPVPRWFTKLLALSKSAVDSVWDKLDGDEG